MKNKLFLILSFVISLTTQNLKAQSFSEDKKAFSNFIKRMYTNTPFEGVKIVDDYDHQYLVSIISLDKAKYSYEFTMNRIALVKAQSQANTFLNGATISMEMVISVREEKELNNDKSVVETIENIKQNSLGFTQGLELLDIFSSSDGKRNIYVYSRTIK
jgi:hypothetical protein